MLHFTNEAYPTAMDIISLLSNTYICRILEMLRKT